MKTWTSSKRAFTMLEIIMVSTVLVSLIIGAAIYFFDFNLDARKSVATNFINYLQTSLKTKQVQMSLHCGVYTTIWPRLQAIKLNDITEKGDPEADCRADQIIHSEDRKFLLGAISPLEVPENPVNNLGTFEECPCTDICDPTCYKKVGYCYNRSTGLIWAEGFLSHCP